MKVLLTTLLLTLFISCQKDRGIVHELDRIKSIGDTNTVEAFALIDSIRPIVRNSSQYAQMKFDLLSIRVADKAEIIPTSDSLIRRVFPYFMEKGTEREIQEVYYYAGSVYRDLEDYPRALSYFLKAKDICTKDFDSLMLRNTYSNLTYVYTSVQDYPNALKIAKIEYALSKEMGILNITDLNQLGTTLMHALFQQKDKSGRIFEESYGLLKKKWNEIRESDRYYYSFKILYYLCLTDRKVLAEECYKMVKREFPECPQTTFQKIAIMRYYMMKDRMEEAALLCRDALNGATHIEDRYDCVKYLFVIYSTMNNTEMAAYYGDKFRRINDTLDFGQRQILAATVNNQYKYHKERDKEMQLEKEGSRRRTTAILVVSASILLIILVALLYYRKKTILLRQLVERENDLARVKDLVHDKELALDKLEKNTAQLSSVLSEVQEKKDELSKKYDSQSSEIKSLQEHLKDIETEKKTILCDFMQAYFQSESKLKDEDFHSLMQKVTEGGIKMTENYWKTLYTIVDGQDPAFSRKVRDHVKPFNDEKVKYCYLMRYGLKSPQIKTIMNTKSSTHYRRMEELNWVWMN
jgi:tetratricopeptide (TPR) repeat protein